MSQKYTVAWIGDTTREWAPQQAPNEKNLAYEVRFEEDPRTVEWSKKAKSDPPEVGETTPPGDIKNSPHGPQFKVNWNQVKEEKGRDGFTSSSGGSRSYSTKGGGKSPDQQASIVRQVALKILSPSINEAGGLTPALKATAQEIENFIGEAHGADVKAAIAASFPGATEIPSAAEQAKEAEDDGIPF